MPARVNLNVPPRLIESARAAQHANREALGGRTLADKIKAKAKARRDAALRAQPLPPDRAGEAPEGRDPLKWRIWRKRRPFRPVDVGVGWFANNNVLSTPTYSNGLSCSQSTNVSITNIYGDGTTSFAVVRTCSGAEVWTGACELRLHIGSGSAGNWITDVFTFSWTATIAKQNWREYQAVDPPFNYTPIDGTLNGSVNNDFDVWCFTLPTGNDSIVLLSAIVRYTTQSSALYGWGGFYTRPMTYTETQTYSVESIGAYLIEKESVTKLPAIAQLPALFDNLVKAYVDTRFGATGFDQATIGQAWRGSDLGVNAIGLPSNTRSFSSASFLYHENPSTFNTDAALRDYQNATGGDQILIAGYRRNSVGLAVPLTEQGVFGVIPGATVTTQPVTPAVLEDELDQQPATNAVAPGADHQMLIAYDYHGGSYCSDRLKLLGIDIP